MRKQKNDTLTEFLDERLGDCKDTSKITVFPLRCGIGKSTYVRYRIFQALSNNEKLIVVTDSVSRLKDYTKDDELSGYINRNKEKLSILTADNVATESCNLYKRNIVCMTTQRYFGLTVEEIKKLTVDRHLILFDEKPYLHELRSITIKTLNNIDSALNMGLDNTTNQTDKEWIVQEWKKRKEKIQKIISENEKKNEGYQFKQWYIFEDGTVLTDDKRFFEIIDKYKIKLNKFKSDTYQNILAVKQLIADGGLFVSMKVSRNNQKRKYNNSFEIVIDNQEKLTNIGAKVFVFDGTADIDPDYRLPCVEMVNCNKYLLPLNNLTIDCVNVTTSKNKH